MGNVALVETINVRGVDLAYDIGGDGPAFVWGHGLTSSMASEDEFGLLDFGILRRQALVVRYDARGHGASGSSADLATYDWRELALDQLALTTALGIDSYVAGGASMGCATAIHATIIAPQRIRGLLLVIPPTAWSTRAAQQGNYELTASLVEAGEIEVLVAGSAATPPPDPLVGVAEWEQRFERTLRTTDPVRLARILRGAAMTDLPDPQMIATISVPVSIIAWTGDSGHPVSTAQRLAELLPQATLTLASTTEQLRGWTAAAQSFLASI